MRPKKKQRMALVTGTVDTVLAPMGFGRQGLNWRRRIGDVLQQFTIFYMQIEGRYRPEWGLNIWRLCQDPKPRAYQLQVRWIFEQTVLRMPERLRCFAASDLDDPIGDDTRAKVIQTVFERHVVPCLELSTTEGAVRKMLGDRKMPHRANVFVDLPENWW